MIATAAQPRYVEFSPGETKSTMGMVHEIMQDRVNLIPFATLTKFFRDNLKQSAAASSE